MIIGTIQLYEMSVFCEFFLGIGIIYFVIHGLFVSFNNTKNYPLIQNSIISLSILFLIMVCFLLFNDSLSSLNYVSFCNTICTDYLSFSAKVFISIATIICLVLIEQYLITQQINSFEYVIIMLFAVLGLFLLCSANDLITAYLAIELQSLSFYVLAAFKKNSAYSVESGLKYFILGAFSSGFFLFGSSLIYGVSGSVNFEVLKELALFETNSFYVKDFLVFVEYSNLVLVGLLFIFVSLFFKLALAPFHFWAPDVYENSPSSSTIFFAIIPKISIFVLLLRLSYFTFSGFVNFWEEYITALAVISVIIGAVVGLEQRKFKSLLAYSSVSHMGYLLISFSTSSVEGFQTLFCYLVIYVGSGLCVWSIFMLTRLKGKYNKKQNKDLGDFILLRKSNFMLALILATALFSIAGLPPMVGFFVKLGVFSVAVKKGFYVIVFISIIFSVVSTFFYLRVIKILFFEPVLVGRLYYPVKNKPAIVTAIFFYLFVFLFLNPSVLYLVSNKMNLLFI